jgi:hypothetical protein
VLDYASRAGSPDWWLVRLGARLDQDRIRFNSLNNYWRGNHPLPFGNRKMREAYKKFQSQSKTNFCKLVAESVTERLKVTGFRTGSDPFDKKAWEWWQANHLDADSGLVHRAAIIMSRAYVIVGQNPANTQMPLVTGEDPRQVIHESAPDNRRNRLAALKTWWDDIQSRQMAVLYLPDTIHYYRTRSTFADPPPGAFGRDAMAQWEVDLDEGEAGSATNILGEVPVVPFLASPDLEGGTLGEFEDVTPIQDRINQQILDRLVISAMQAYRQRWAVGVELEDENGNPTDDFDPGADLLWNVSNEDAKFGEFQVTDLTGILKAVESDVQNLAAITRTPPHYLLGSISNASGDALAAAETGLSSKVTERSTEFGESWEMVYQLAGRVLGQEVPDTAEVVWSNPQFRTLTEKAAASVQLMTAGVPWRARMEALDYTPVQIDQMQADRAADALLNAVTTPAVPAGVPGPPGGAAAPASAAARAAIPVGTPNGARP